MKQRIHKNHTPPNDRYAFREQVMWALLNNQMTYGQALKQFRIELFGMNQKQFAQQVGISRKALSDLENDRTVSINTINQAFKPMGLHLNLVPHTYQVLKDMVENNEK